MEIYNLNAAGIVRLTNRLALGMREQGWGYHLHTRIAIAFTLLFLAFSTIAIAIALPPGSSPTLIIWGREDGMTPVALGERFKREIPNSELQIIERCGHFANVEQADEFNRAVKQFLNSSR